MAHGIDKPGGIAGWHKPSLAPARPGWVVCRAALPDQPVIGWPCAVRDRYQHSKDKNPGAENTNHAPPFGSVPAVAKWIK